MAPVNETGAEQAFGGRGQIRGRMAAGGKHKEADRRSKAAGGRRCLLSGETLPKSQLIRFVAGPGGGLVPDIEERLPGRGLWLRAERDMIDQACAKKAFSRAARTQLTVPDGLADQVEAMIRQKCLDLLGLARRGGQLAGGAQQVRDMLSGKGAALFLSASDGSADERGKMSALAPGVPVCTRFTSAELGRAIGRERVVHVAVAEGGLAARLADQLRRLAGLSAEGGTRGGTETVAA